MPLHKNLKAWASSFVACSALLVMVGCSDNSTIPAAPDISSFGDGGGSDRPVVITDGAVGGDYDAPIKIVTKPPADAATIDAKVVDAKAVADGATDVATTSTPRQCDLLKQDCPRQEGCYPFGNGGSRCEFPVQSGVGSSLCTQDNQCLAGFACAAVLRGERQCAVICDRNVPCGGKDSCAPIAGYNDVGYCKSN